MLFYHSVQPLFPVSYTHLDVYKRQPYGYEKGMLYFFEKDNKLEGKVKFGEGNKIKLTHLRLSLIHI